MQDKYGVELDLNISKFKSKMNEASKEAEMFGKKVKSSVGQVVNGIDTHYTGPSKLIAKTKEELQQTSAEMNRISKSSSNVGGTISKSFDKGLKSVKRITLGFLGARSAFMLFRKYLGEYQSQNEDFANKMQLTTNVLVNSLAPAFEFFGNVIQYAVIGLARIIELLTGVNILAKTVDNGFKGASKSAKEFNDNLSGLDEISNIQEDSGGLSTGIGSQLNALAEFQKKIAEVDAWFKKMGIDKAILKIKDALSNVWKWIEEHPFLTGAFVGGLITFKDVILPALIGKLAGTGAGGALSLLGAFKALIAVGVTAWVIDTSNNLSKEAEEVQKYADEVLKTADNWQKVVDKRIEYMKLTGDFNAGDETKQETENQIFQLKLAREQLQSKLTLKEWIFNPAEYYDMKDQIKEIDRKIKDLRSLQDQITVGQEITNDEIGKSVKLSDKLKSGLEKAVQKAELLKKNSKIDLKLNTKQADNEMKQWINKWKNFDIGVSSKGTIKLPSYDVGTNYVPRDQIAMVHEGEAIIPKKYNNSEYLGQMGNSETNMLLMELNRSILEFANRPQTLNVNGKELAKVTYGDFQEESSRRGTNTSIRRV